jgi:hypothetical protein
MIASLSTETLLKKARERLEGGETQKDTAAHLKKLIEDEIWSQSKISISQRLTLKGMYKVACLFARQSPALHANDFGVHE